jgi:hypothetical protein
MSFIGSFEPVGLGMGDVPLFLKKTRFVRFKLKEIEEKRGRFDCEAHLCFIVGCRRIKTL